MYILAALEEYFDLCQTWGQKEVWEGEIGPIMKKGFLYSRRVFFFSLLGGLCQEVSFSLGITEVEALSLLP